MSVNKQFVETCKNWWWSQTVDFRKDFAKKHANYDKSTEENIIRFYEIKVMELHDKSDIEKWKNWWWEQSKEFRASFHIKYYNRNISDLENIANFYDIYYTNKKFNLI